MPREISLSTIVEASKLQSNVPLIQAVEIYVKSKNDGAVVNTMRVVNNNETINFEGNDFTPTIFDVKFSESAGSVGAASISINDFTRVIRVQEESYGGAVGFGVRVLLLNSADLSVADMDLLYDVESSSWSNYTVAWKLGSENALLVPFPPSRQFKNRCRHKYKGTRCKYTGALATCDLSLDGPNGCKVHNNTIHFGAFAGLQRQ